MYPGVWIPLDAQATELEVGPPRAIKPQTKLLRGSSGVMSVWRGQTAFCPHPVSHHEDKRPSSTLEVDAELCQPQSLLTVVLSAQPWDCERYTFDPVCGFMYMHVHMQSLQLVFGDRLSHPAWSSPIWLSSLASMPLAICLYLPNAGKQVHSAAPGPFHGT